jgi:hypothetical protein
MLHKKFRIDIHMYIYIIVLSFQYNGMSHFKTILEGLKKKPLTNPRQSLEYVGLNVCNCTKLRNSLFLDDGQTGTTYVGRVRIIGDAINTHTCLSG